MNMREIMETTRVSAVGLFGFVTQLTALDLFFKVSIGFLTCIYLTFKIWEMATGKKGNKDDDK